MVGKRSSFSTFASIGDGHNLNLFGVSCMGWALGEDETLQTEIDLIFTLVS
jgi:hypothetical protein